MTVIPKVAAKFSTSLAAKISSSATSLTLVSITDKAGNNLTGQVFLTIDEGSANEEFMDVTIASDKTGTINARGLDPQNPSTEVSSLKKEHGRGAPVKITSYGYLARIARILNGDDTFPNKLSYASHPTFTGNTELVDKSTWTIPRRPAGLTLPPQSKALPNSPLLRLPQPIL